MTSKSPTLSIHSRESIGADTFTRRREVFNKNDSVFLPSSPVKPKREVKSEITSNSDQSPFNFQRNSPVYSSMRETRREEISEVVEFRQRKFSENLTSEQNQNDEVDYRVRMSERTRRLSRLRREFLTSNLHDTTEGSFIRGGTRASLPATKLNVTYRIESPNIHKFPFAEPFATPTPARRFVPKDSEDNEENQDSEEERHKSLPPLQTNNEIDHRKIFEDLVNRYSPLRKPVDWSIPPTKPKIVGTLPKKETRASQNDSKDETDSHKEICDNGTDKIETKYSKVNNVENNDSQLSLTEINEKNDKVPELPPIQRRMSRESTRKPIPADVSIPALLEKINAEAETNKPQQPNKIKRKRSFLDKLLNRKKSN